MMPEHRRRVCLLLAALICIAMPGVREVHASIADATGAELEVALVTYGPGTIYWERFGHDAIELRDTVSGDAWALNYGVFDFAQDDFMLNFLRGHMRYRMDAVPAGEDIAYFEVEGRWVRRQVLALSAAQRSQLRDLLLRNLRPENAAYDYQYFTDNCTTRVRDALDRVLDGTIERQLQAPEPGVSYRSETDRLLASQPWLMVPVDLGLGPFADQPLSRWQAAFLPGLLMSDLRDVSVREGDSVRRLVASDRLLARSRLAAPPPQPPDLRLPLFLAGLVIGLLQAMAGLKGQSPATRWMAALTAVTWSLAAGLAGLFLTLLWAFTEHRAAWGNQNLLCLPPLALLLVPAAWRLHRPIPRRSRLACWTVLTCLALTLCAALVKLTPLAPQHNAAWILLALPAWLGLAFALWRRGNPWSH